MDLGRLGCQGRLGRHEAESPQALEPARGRAVCCAESGEGTAGDSPAKQQPRRAPLRRAHRGSRSLADPQQDYQGWLGRTPTRSRPAHPSTLSPSTLHSGGPCTWAGLPLQTLDRCRCPFCSEYCHAWRTRGSGPGGSPPGACSAPAGPCGRAPLDPLRREAGAWHWDPGSPSASSIAAGAHVLSLAPAEKWTAGTPLVASALHRWQKPTAPSSSHLPDGWLQEHMLHVQPVPHQLPRLVQRAPFGGPKSSEAFREIAKVATPPCLRLHQLLTPMVKLLARPLCSPSRSAWQLHTDKETPLLSRPECLSRWREDWAGRLHCPTPERSHSALPPSPLPIALSPEEWGLSSSCGAVSYQEKASGAPRRPRASSPAALPSMGMEWSSRPAP
mmetsp:Transcript_51776/g.150334  ORF Transcript_51776/g.150334 Transcript_51776/m.150334 type:complete len:388 (+) Transcript_51776:242-1405(+)